MKMKIIICHHEQNLTWINELKHEYIVYNKNPINNGKYHIDLPNVGFDTIAYLSYIIDNYYDLPDYVCFSQDNPFFHCASFLNIVNNFNFDKEFVPLGRVYERGGKVLDRTINLCKKHGIAYKLPIKFINSAQCIVSRNLIKKRDIDQYEKIKSLLPTYEVKNETNYMIEYLWPTILNFNEELI